MRRAMYASSGSILNAARQGNSSNRQHHGAQYIVNTGGHTDTACATAVTTAPHGIRTNSSDSA